MSSSRWQADPIEEPRSHRGSVIAAVLVALVLALGVKLLHDARPARPTAWRYWASDRIRVAPATDGARLFAASRDRRIHALAADSGQPLWHRDLSGAATTPLALEEALLLLGTDTGHLVALDAAQGGVVWTHALGAPVRGPIVRLGDRLIAGADQGRLAAVARGDGSRRWHVDLPAAPSAGPVADAQRLYLGFADGHVEARDAAGTAVWSVQVLKARVDGLTPDGDRLWVTSGRQVLEIDAGSGRTRRALELDRDLAAPAMVAGGELLLLSGDGVVIGYHPRGTVKWWHDLGAAPAGTPALLDGTLLVAGQDQRVRALDVSRREIRWRRRLPADVLAPPVAGRERVYLATWAGQIVALTP